jgi:hypothetical protein
LESPVEATGRHGVAGSRASRQGGVGMVDWVELTAAQRAAYRRRVGAEIRLCRRHFRRLRNKAKELAVVQRARQLGSDPAWPPVLWRARAWPNLLWPMWPVEWTAKESWLDWQPWSEIVRLEEVERRAPPDTPDTPWADWVAGVELLVAEVRDEPAV